MQYFFSKYFQQIFAIFISNFVSYNETGEFKISPNYYIIFLGFGNHSALSRYTGNIGRQFWPVLPRSFGMRSRPPHRVQISAQFEYYEVIDLESSLTVKTITLQNELRQQDTVLVTYKIEYPHFRSAEYPSSLARINQLYRSRALAYENYLKRRLLPLAAEQYQFSVEQGYPFNPYEAVEVFTITDCRRCILSLYTDRYEYTGGAHGNTVRTSDTWNWNVSRRLRLRGLFCRQTDYRQLIFQEVRAQIAKEPEIYFENYEELIVENFSENNFYTTPEGIVIYYQQYDIAPYSSGIREFLIPYAACVYDPTRLCFRR